MLIKAVIIFALFILAMGLYAPSGINVIGFKNHMETRSLATGMGSLMLAEQNYIQMENQLPTIADWESDLRSTRSTIPDFRPYQVTYNEELGEGRYFCLTANVPDADQVEQFYDIHDRLNYLEAIISTDCGDTANAPTSTAWLSEDDINITIFTGN